MSLIRCFYRIFALIFWFIAAGSLTIPYWFNNWKCIKKCSRIAKLWGAGIAKILNLEIHVHGDPTTFTGGLIVSNHVSYLDIIAHAATFPLRFAPKAEIKYWPILGWYLKTSHPIWVDRTSKQGSKDMLKQFSETMQNDIPLIVYPEGTSSDGQGLLPFKSTPFEAASQGDFSIFPILLKYKEEKGQPPLCWYGDMALAPHVWKILGLPKITVDLYLLEPIRPEGKSRKDLADIVHNYMKEEYLKILS